MDAIFFKNQKALRAWFIANHEKRTEFYLGYYKVKSGKPSVNWSESVDEAICFGWIDGIRKSIDEERYKIRFTPRKKKSHWSTVNIEKVKKLKAAGLMFPAGLAAFERMDENNARQAAFEQKQLSLDKSSEMELKKNAKAWQFFQSLSPSVKKSTIWWLMSAKREATRLRRLAILIASCEENRKIPTLRRKGE